jgi:hypothetical protein
MSQILVSVLLPTRQRTKMVESSVRSLLKSCADPSRIEIVVAYDNDDHESRKYFTSKSWTDLMQDLGSSYHIMSCEPWGYANLNKYYNVMAKSSRGKWLLIWNDDALMNSAGWDQQIHEHQDFVGMLHMTTTNFKSNLTLFPLIPRKWLELFGEISPQQITDSWIQDICHEADAVKVIPATVFHDRYDVTGNNLDDTYKNRWYNKKGYNHESMKLMRQQWAQKLKQCRE